MPAQSCGSSLVGSHFSGDSPATRTLLAGVLLQVYTGLAVAGIGLAMLPVLRPYSLRLARAYLALRVLECSAIVLLGEQAGVAGAGRGAAVQPGHTGVVTAVSPDGTTTVEIAGSGDQALKAASEQPPDLIILDLNLPVLGGLASAGFAVFMIFTFTLYFLVYGRDLVRIGAGLMPEAYRAPFLAAALRFFRPRSISCTSFSAVCWARRRAFSSLRSSRSITAGERTGQT
jgi:hypothetical protein